jgi:amino acid transporter
MPSALASTNEKGVPVVSVLVAAVVGTLAFGPFKSWNALVSVVTGATAIMYAFAPVSLAALRRIDSGRRRSYEAPMPSLVLPAAFCAANLIIYWGGFDSTWKLGCAMLVGLVLFGVGAWRAGSHAMRTIRHSLWIGPWLGGQVFIGAIGRYGGGRNILPNWVDILVVIGFSLAIFYWATGSSLDREQSAAAIAKDAQQLNF